MHADWDGLEFKIMEYKDTGTYIVGGTDDIQVSMSLADLCQPACLTASSVWLVNASPLPSCNLECNMLKLLQPADRSFCNAYK